MSSVFAFAWISAFAVNAIGEYHVRTRSCTQRDDSTRCAKKEWSERRIYCRRTHHSANLFVANILRFVAMRVFTAFFALLMPLYHNSLHSCLSIRTKPQFCRFFVVVLLCASNDSCSLHMQSISREEQQQDEKKTHKNRFAFFASILLQILFSCVLRRLAFGFRSTNRTSAKNQANRAHAVGIDSFKSHLTCQLFLNGLYFVSFSHFEKW